MERAIETPSRVDIGMPGANGARSTMVLRPSGPIEEPTACASSAAPLSRRSRASFEVVLVHDIQISPLQNGADCRLIHLNHIARFARVIHDIGCRADGAETVVHDQKSFFQVRHKAVIHGMDEANFLIALVGFWEHDPRRMFGWTRTDEDILPAW